MRSLGRIFAAVVLVLVFASVAIAQPYPPGAAVRCNKGALPPGDFITCSADGFKPGRQVNVRFRPARSGMAPLAASGVYALAQDPGGELMGTPTADASGEATLRFQIPTSTPDGPATITFEGDDANGDFRRVAVATVTIDSGLPATGAEGVSRWLALAAGLLTLGTGMVALTTRRRARDEAERVPTA